MMNKLISSSLNRFLIEGLFGEGPAERRERLKNLISRLSDDEIAQKLRKKEEQEKKEEERENVCFNLNWFHASFLRFILIFFLKGGHLVS